jgi:hypothetical protein
VPQDERKQE